MSPRRSILDSEEKREKNRASVRRAYAKLRIEVYRNLGDRCANCGFKDPRALQIDHINGGGHREARAIRVLGIYRKIRDGDTEGYQLLCANCNSIKRVENGEHRQAYGLTQ
jgi:hypothetical protein